MEQTGAKPLIRVRRGSAALTNNAELDMFPTFLINAQCAEQRPVELLDGEQKKDDGRNAFPVEKMAPTEATEPMSSVLNGLRWRKAKSVAQRQNVRGKNWFPIRELRRLLPKSSQPGPWPQDEPSA